MTNTQAIIAANVARVREQIAASAARVGRTSDSVRLVAVTKYVDAAAARPLIDAGCLVWGESRPQELWRKCESLADVPIEWHFIGHLQRNKLERTLTHVHLLHSGDSLRLLQAVDQWATQHARRMRVLVEVNVSGDETKHGFAPAELPALGTQLTQLHGLDVQGLMTMAAREGDLDRARADFVQLRHLRDELRGCWPERIRELPELSMGMSGDFTVAIEEGATLVRVGSALFEGLA